MNAFRKYIHGAAILGLEFRHRVGGPDVIDGINEHMCRLLSSGAHDHSRYMPVRLVIGM
jgi:hypothetical protein